MTTGLVLLLAMVGLPIMPVLCDAVCPQASPALTTARAASTSRVAAAQPDCHEVPRQAAHLAEAAGTREGDVDRRTIATSAPVHGCDHPTVVSSRWSADGMRVPPPQVLTRDVTTHLSALQAPSVVQAVVRSSAGPPTRAPLGAFSLVLRI